MTAEHFAELTSFSSSATGLPALYPIVEGYLTSFLPLLLLLHCELLKEADWWLGLRYLRQEPEVILLHLRSAVMALAESVLASLTLLQEFQELR